MRVIKLGLISLVFFSVLITIISLFFPSHVRISKAIDINAGKEAVMEQLKDPANWKKWYPGADTLALLTRDGKIKGIETGPGKGLMITAVNDSEVMAAGLGPGSGKGATGWNIFAGSSPGSTTVQWYMDFYLRWYPWEKFSSLLLEKRYGPLMEKGLTRLKALLEK